MTTWEVIASTVAPRLIRPHSEVWGLGFSTSFGGDSSTHSTRPGSSWDLGQGGGGGGGPPASRGAEAASHGASRSRGHTCVCACARSHVCESRGRREEGARPARSSRFAAHPAQLHPRVHIQAHVHGELSFEKPTSRGHSSPGTRIYSNQAVRKAGHVGNAGRAGPQAQRPRWQADFPRAGVVPVDPSRRLDQGPAAAPTRAVWARLPLHRPPAE